MDDTPACFNSSEDFEAWLDLAVETDLEKPRLSFCVDCTKRYQWEMKKEGRCAFPDLEIIEEEDDEWE